MKKYDLRNVFALSFIPAAGIFGTIWHIWKYGIIWQEPVLLFIFWIITGLGITVGYHRLFSHRSFKAHPILDWIMVICGAAALENSALKWCSDHRRHHKHLDTDKDPYSITEGFFHAHIGWILKNKPEPIEKVNDLKEKLALRFQYKHYFLLFIIFGLLIPLTLGFIWGRPLGALFWGVLLRITLVHHFTYFINSICHYIGNKTYDSQSTSGDSWYISLLTFGEGYHNYHHKFQWDYRNGIRWFHFDPSKWFIWFLSKIGLAKELKKANYLQIMKARSMVIWSQIYSCLAESPDISVQSYHQKLDAIKEKIKTLEQSWKRADQEIIENISKNRKQLISVKLFQRQKKQCQLEYRAILNTLSLMLIAVREGQVLGKQSILS